MNHTRMLARLAAVLLAVAVTIGLVTTSGVASAPVVEPLAGYEPQTTCSPGAKPGTKVLATWIVARHGGRFGGISRACGGSASEHKEGRAFDWSLRATSAKDRARARAVLSELFAVGPSGESAELARRMGLMYVIWNDRMYAAYDGFSPRPYRVSSCKRLIRCSPTLRHRDHMHLSLTRDGGAGRTSWYAGRLP